MTGLIYDPRFIEHDPGPGHPERPDRLRAIVERLEHDHLWERLQPVPFEPAPRGLIERLHDPAYVDRVFAACEMGERHLDSQDVGIAPQSATIAQLAVGGAVAAVDAVMRGEVTNAVALLRPPGHHAERDRAMGFCLFNNIALAADHLVRDHGLDRVAVVDWDVHHGNGTQHLLEERADVLVVSIHEHPMHLYPGTGFAHEKGAVGTPGEGYTLNLPLQPGADDATYRRVMTEKVMPALSEYKPQFILISAGFDAAVDDPLAHMELTPQCFAWMTRQLKDAAEFFCQGRLVSMLEGGYDLRCLAESVALHIGVLLEPDGHDGMMAMKAGI